MKTLTAIIALGAALFSASANAQVFDFSTFGLGQAITVNGGLAQEGSTANLTFELRYGSSEGSLSTITFTPSDMFFLDGDFSGGGAKFQRSSELLVPGFSSGQAPILQLRAYETSAGSFDAATIRGSSQFFSTTLAADNGSDANAATKMLASNDPVYSRGFQGFNIAAVPEPTTIALGVLGGLGLLARRRRNAKA